MSDTGRGTGDTGWQGTQRGCEDQLRCRIFLERSMHEVWKARTGQWAGEEQRSSPMGAQHGASVCPNPTDRDKQERTRAPVTLTSNLLWPEHWAACSLQRTGQEERGLETQQERLEPDNRENFLLGLPGFQTGMTLGDSLSPRVFRRGCSHRDLEVKGPLCT